MSIATIAEFIGINVDDWILIDAYQPTTILKSESRTVEKSSTIDLTESQLQEGLVPLNDKLTISFSNGNNETNIPDFEYYEEVSKYTRIDTRYWLPPTYLPDTFDLPEETDSTSADGEGTGSDRNQTKAQTNAKEKATNAAIKDAEEKLLASLGDGWKIDGEIEYDITYEDEDYDTSWFGTVHEYKYTIRVKASANIKKSGKYTLFVQESGTGCWGEPELGKAEPEPELPMVVSDELRIYSGNSFTISCTDSNYEITKVRVHFSGSNQIVDDTSVDYFARFVDDRIDLSTPITGDESSHLFGMEYNETDGWHQWSGSGRQSVTLNLADYKLTTNYDLGNMTWEDFFSGNWETAITYDYEYSEASIDFNKYIVVDRKDVKCTPKANVDTE